MDLELQNKTVLVSGSSGGIGFAIASRFAQEGAHVYINGRTHERVDRAITHIKKAFPHSRLSPLVTDLSTEAGVTDTFRHIPEIDILINNLGIYEEVPFFHITDEQWHHIFDVNVMSGVRLSRHYMPLMMKKNWGRIIFISSESGLNIPVDMIHYGMTKTAQIAIARGLAEIAKGTHVTVNSILPGPTKSEGVEKFIQEMADKKHQTLRAVEEDFFKTVRPTSLLQRFATPDEVAHLVAYIASPLASATTGAALRVDGGNMSNLL